MATSANQLAKSGKFGDLRRRLVFLLLALVVYRLGAHIPVPGIDQLFKGQQGGILNLFNMFSGGALQRFTVFALGIMPYISASIIMQLMTYVVPTLESLKKEGESGRRKITQYTRYGTLGLALFQSLGIALALEGSAGLVLHPGFGLRWAIVAPALEAQYVGRDPTDLCIVNHPAAGYRCGLVCDGRGHALAEGHLFGPVAWAADLRAAVCGDDHLLLLLLHRAGVQQQRDGGQP